MKALYKRIVTLGMISATAMLAWIYCMMEYRDAPIYIITVSIALVISVYALLLAAMNLHSAKEENLRRYIDDKVNSVLKGDDSMATKLGKASYIHLKKINTTINRIEDAYAINCDRNEKLLSEINSSTNNALTQSINKAVKVTLKYNELNNNKLLSYLGNLIKDLESFSDLVEKCSEDERVAFAESINALSSDIIQVKNRIISMSGRISSISSPSDSDLSEGPKDSLDIFEEDAPVFDDILNEPDNMENISDDDNLEYATDDEINNADEETAAADEISTEAEQPAGDAAASIIDSVPDANVMEDPNKMLSPDDIAALFAAAAPQEASAKEEASAQKIADVIPFPNNEETDNPQKASEPEISEQFDPNKQLSPEEIEALFASAMPDTSAPAEEATPQENTIKEPEPTAPAVSSDPNKQLSPEEIAALFASIQ